MFYHKNRKTIQDNMKYSVFQKYAPWYVVDSKLPGHSSHPRIPSLLASFLLEKLKILNNRLSSFPCIRKCDSLLATGIQNGVWLSSRTQMETSSTPGHCSSTLCTLCGNHFVELDWLLGQSKWLEPREFSTLQTVGCGLKCGTFLESKGGFFILSAEKKVSVVVWIRHLFHWNQVN